MQGDKAAPGIIPRAVDDIFEVIKQTPNREFLLRISYLEIYKCVKPLALRGFLGLR